MYKVVRNINMQKMTVKENKWAALGLQKITMVIQVIPSPRLNVVCKCQESIRGVTYVGRSPDDRLFNEAANNATIETEIETSGLAFDIAPEDLLLLDSESMESLCSGKERTIIVKFLNQNRDAVGDADKQNYTKVRLTFIPIRKKPHLANDGIGREKGNRRNDTGPNGIFERLLKKCKKCADTIKHRLSRTSL
jgi:hypothetical protein